MMPRPGTQALVVSRADKIYVSALFAGSLVRNNITLQRSLILYSQMLLDADIRQNFILEEVNLEKQKVSKRNFNQKVKSMQQSLRLSWIKLICFRTTEPRTQISFELLRSVHACVRGLRMPFHSNIEHFLLQNKRRH